jgi:hypothetical protein
MKRLLIILLVLTSCITPQKVFYSPTTNSPNFFACNQWIDTNQDGLYDANEFQNIKNSFRSYENIIFIGRFYKPVGTMLKYKIFTPAGSVLMEDSHASTFNPAIFGFSSSVRDLLSGGTPGVWKVQWFVEDILVNETLVTLIQ